MKELNTEQLQGIAGTVIVHVILLLILLFTVIEKPLPEEEDGVPVVMGNVERAKGDAYTYTEVKVAPQPAERTTEVPPVKSPEEPLITQTEEETVALNTAKEKKQEAPEPPKKTPEQEEQERKAAEEERKRQEAEKMARVANSKIAGAFGKGTTMTDKGNSSEHSGNEGSKEGNENTGVTAGIGGYGTFDLNGRTLGGDGSLPRPEYNVQEEGRVVVNITVNPAGRVIRTSINNRTNTQSRQLRDAALKAAGKAVFNSVSIVDNQMGTITYYFKLK